MPRGSDFLGLTQIQMCGQMRSNHGQNISATTVTIYKKYKDFEFIRLDVGGVFSSGVTTNITQLNVLDN